MKRLVPGAVLDASVVLKLLVPEADSDAADALLTELTRAPRWLGAPELLVTECENALWTRVRRGTVRAAAAERQVSLLLRFIGGLDLRPMTSLALAAWRLARALDITVYDASYVALAEVQVVPLVTADERLARRCAGLPGRVVTLRGLA